MRRVRASRNLFAVLARRGQVAACGGRGESLGPKLVSHAPIAVARKLRRDLGDTLVQDYFLRRGAAAAVIVRGCGSFMIRVSWPTLRSNSAILVSYSEFVIFLIC
jgi:hypothetical protein